MPLSSAITDFMFLDFSGFWCTSCDKELEQTFPLWECTNSQCGEKFAHQERACPHCNVAFSRRLADHGCPECNTEAEDYTNDSILMCPKCHEVYLDESDVRECCEADKLPSYIQSLEEECLRLEELNVTKLKRELVEQLIEQIQQFAGERIAVLVPDLKEVLLKELP